MGAPVEDSVLGGGGAIVDGAAWGSCSGKSCGCTGIDLPTPKISDGGGATAQKRNDLLDGKSKEGVRLFKIPLMEWRKPCGESS
jgi:hypothetical protein